MIEDLVRLGYYLIVGAGVGSMYALAGVAISLLFNGTGLINLAQGEMMMAGGLTAVFAIEAGWPYPLAFLAGVVVAAIVAVVAGVSHLPAMSRDRFDIDLVILGSLGLAIALSNGLAAVFGRAVYRLDEPIDVEFELGGIRVPIHYPLMVMVLVGLVVAIKLLYDRTDIGIKLRAVSSDIEAARLTGLRVRRLVVLAWLLAGTLAGAAGVLIGSVAYVSAFGGLQFTVMGLAAAVIGGLYRPPGAAVGGLLLGISQVIAAAYVGTMLRELVPTIAILAILLFRPQGIFSGGTIMMRRV